MQGQQLAVYGGECDPHQDENQAENAEDNGPLVHDELCLLEPDMRLWVTVPVTGTGHGVRGQSLRSLRSLPAQTRLHLQLSLV